MKKEIENIFSQEKVIKEIPNKTIKIIVDTREKNSLVFSNLVERNANTGFEKLEIGDYLIKNIIIERKTFSDFQSSIIDKRLLQQLENMRKYGKKILIIEGFSYNYQNSKIHENAIRGMFLSASLDFNTPIIFTENEQDTAKFLITLARRQEKEKNTISLRIKKELKTPDQQKRFILEGFPGIGPVISEKLIKDHPNLKSIFNLKKVELTKKDYLTEKIISDFLEILEKN